MKPPRAALGNRLAPARFLAFLALLPVGVIGWRRIDPAASWQDAVALGFDFAAVLFLASLVPLLRDTSAAAIRRHAGRNDTNRALVLAITSTLTLAIMAAISGELALARAGDGMALARLVGTLALIWLFANSVYALHYAHAYYTPADGADRGGIAFPGQHPPGYADFAYFAFTLGMTFQTSDAVITAPAIRRVALLHAMAAFVFNIGVIAFTINALSGK